VEASLGSTVWGVGKWLLGIIAAILIEELLRRFVRPRLRGWRARRNYRRTAPAYVELLLGYTTHLRDVSKAFGRARGETSEKRKETSTNPVTAPTPIAAPVLIVFLSVSHARCFQEESA
jgi:hypothetical protein